MRAVFPRVLEKHLDGGTPLMILLGDIGVFGFRNIFAKHPDRILNLGILEQASVGLAAGFSIQGFLPVFHSIAPFLVERSFEQLKIDFGYQRLTGIFVSAGGSFDYSRLGCTHHCPADVNLMLNIPGFTVCVPGTADELSEILDLSIQNPRGAVYIRMSEFVNSSSHPLSVREPVKIRTGKGPIIAVVGPALSWVENVIEAIDANVFYLNIVNPTSVGNLIAEIEQDSSRSVAVIEPYYSGSLAGQILRGAVCPIRLYEIGVPREFIHKYGTFSELRLVLGLDDATILERLRTFFH